MLYCFSFFGGVAALLASPALPSAWVAFPVAFAAFVACILCRRYPRGLLVCGACCGYLFAGYHARDYLVHRWPASLTDERVIASVTVDSIPAPLDAGWAFDGVVRIEAPATPPQGASAGWGEPLHVRLMSRDGAFRPRAGERWRLLLALRAPRGRSNPGGRDFERNQFRDGVQALGTVIASGLNRRIDAGHRPLDALRERISEHIDARVTDRDASALIAALAVGDTGRVSREQWRVFNATGTTHLVAISGMHVTLFAVIAFALARRFWSGCVWVGGKMHASAFKRAVLWVASWPRETFAAALGLGAATGYATLAGLSVPTQRTLLMLAVWLLARSMARASRPFQPFALALLAVLLLDPFAPLSAGFWLSFAAMAAIIVAASGRFLRQSTWREALSVQVAVTITLLPFTLALFSSISLIGPPVNLLAIPAMSWVLVPTVLVSLALLPFSAFASNGVLAVAEWMHNLAWPWLAASSDVPWALMHASPPWWWYGLAIMALVVASLPWPLLLRVAALVCVIPLAAATDHPLESGDAEVIVLDTGEGTAVVVHTAGHVLVYGTGDSYGTGGRMAETIVVPYLRSVGARAIDRLVLNRLSAATGAGVAALWAEMPIRQTLVGEVSAEVDPSSTDCASVPAAWVWDGVHFTLSQADASHACVLTVGNGREEVTLPGDVAAVVESTRGRWIVVPGRRGERSAGKYVALHRELQGVRTLATAERGAIRFQLHAARGLEGPDAQRAHRRTLWAASP